MSDDMVVLRDRNPATAEFVAAWRQKYERTFDLTDEAEKANFYEGMAEMARHIATSADTATLSTMLSVDGVSFVRATAVPHSDTGNASRACPPVQPWSESERKEAIPIPNVFVEPKRKGRSST